MTAAKVFQSSPNLAYPAKHFFGHLADFCDFSRYLTFDLSNLSIFVTYQI